MLGGMNLLALKARTPPIAAKIANNVRIIFAFFMCLMLLKLKAKFYFNFTLDISRKAVSDRLPMESEQMF